jgi:hypothetical protein
LRLATSRAFLYLCADSLVRIFCWRPDPSVPRQAGGGMLQEHRIREELGRRFINERRALPHQRRGTRRFS